MVSPHYIKYAGISSEELNMIDLVMCAALDSDNGETNTYLSRSAVQSESHDGRYKQTARYKYDEVFAPKFTFLKKNFGDFSMDEVRILLKYLTSKDTTALLEVFYDDSEAVSWAAIGGWTEINLQKLANNRTIGVTAVFSAIHPFALSDLYTVTKTITSSSDNKIIINIDTDDNQPVYPVITVKHNGSVVRVSDGTVYTSTSDMVQNTVYYNGTTYFWKTYGRTSGKSNPYANNDMWSLVTINNKDYSVSDTINTNTVYYYTKSGMYYWIDPYYFHKKDGGSAPALSTTSVKLTNTHTDFFNNTKILPSVIVKNNNHDETITIDCANKIISSLNDYRIFGDDFVDWRWLELRDGKNEITIEGNCDVKLEWREVRKIGEY